MISYYTVYIYRNRMRSHIYICIAAKQNVSLYLYIFVLWKIYNKETFALIKMHMTLRTYQGLEYRLSN